MTSHVQNSDNMRMVLNVRRAQEEMSVGNYRAAESLLQESFDISLQLGDGEMIVMVLTSLYDCQKHMPARQRSKPSNLVPLPSHTRGPQAE